MTPAVKSKTAPLTARVVGEITGRARSTVLWWMESGKLPSSFKVIENRRVRVTTRASLAAFMRRTGIESKVKSFSVWHGAAPKSKKPATRRRAG